PPEPLTNVLGEYLAKHGKTQLRIAETEKYAHVTFFFSGGKAQGAGMLAAYWVSMTKPASCGARSRGNSLN
ncbi:hypothetical protein ACV343_32815, partial [Pseudomonas aeruginosa]